MVSIMAFKMLKMEVGGFVADCLTMNIHFDQVGKIQEIEGKGRGLFATD